jgi:VWFA-related protein
MSGRLSRYWTSTVVAAAVCLAVVNGQDLPPPTFRTGIDVVHVDVSVLDTHRRPVQGLTAAEFTVLEDGQPRAIVAFAPVEVPGPALTPEDTAAWVREVPSDQATNAIAAEGRLVVVVMGRTEDLTEIIAARRIAHATFDALGPNDLGGLVFTTGFYNAGGTHNFTADTARLHQAVDRPMSLMGAPAGAPADRMGPIAYGFTAANGREALTADAPAGPNQTDCYCNLCMFEKIEDVARAVAGVPGRRKQIVYAGSSFPAPQLSPMSDCAEPVRLAREAMERELSQANVAISVVDPSGADGTANQLPYLTGLTGGRLALWDNEAEKVVPAILDESGSYYVLAFTAGERTRAKDGLNRVEVRVSRPGVTVQSRTAYELGRTPQALQAELRKSPVVRALEATLPPTALPMRLTATPVAAPGRDTASVVVALRTEPPALGTAQLSDTRLQPGTAREDRIDALVAALDPQGKIVASTRHTGTIPWMEDGIVPAPYELLSRLELKPGRYEIRAIMDVHSGERSGVYGFVEIPNYREAALALSGVLLEATPAPQTAPKEAFADLLPIVPTARRDFEFTDRVRAFARVVRDGGRPGEPTTVTSRVLDTRGGVTFEVRGETTAAGDYTLDLPIGDLPAGEHLLEIRATSGTNESSERLRFRVR